ncbi:hypothetical protein Nepgr_009880 [Nepenthes gracilis]|uniref:Uncharacterized protein n=1 Tax=Nepenthes gracilis TaxID=150966 RepID=A0AAD3XKT1_NEPGR|nr:hypothetical protein Nepgr_009880 [Nepenthes gracilis]
MVEQMDTLSESEPLDIDSVRSRITELTSILRNSNNVPDSSSSDSEKLLQDCVLSLETKVKQIVSEHSDIGSLKDEDLDAYLEGLSEELRMVEAENANISDEIEGLRKAYVKGTCQLERDLEGLNCMLDYAKRQGLGELKPGIFVGCSIHAEDHTLLSKGYSGHNFKILSLNNQIEKNKATLKSLQDLDSIFKRFEAIAKIEEAFTGLKVIEFEGNCLKLLLRTYIPNVEGLMCHQQLEDVVEPSELNHEILVEVMDGTLELKNVEIFPNDVYIVDIVEAAASFRKVNSGLSLLEMRCSLEWFLQKAQDRIIMCTLRQRMVKAGSKSRHSLEYLDKDDLIIAHMVVGVDAFIKLSQGWPLSTSALKLVSLKSSGHNAREISWSLLCKVEEVANSLDCTVRANITQFVDAIEEILVQRMCEDSKLNAAAS